MLETVREAIVRLEQGLHARPAARFVQLAARFESEITIRHGARSASAKGILGVISLGIREGNTVSLHARGPDAEAAVADLCAFLARSGVE